MHTYCKYYDDTEVVFSDIIVNEDGIETVQVHFERPTENGFDSIRFELPTYKILYKEGNYSDEEIKMFKEILKKSAPSFFKWAKEDQL